MKECKCAQDKVEFWEGEIVEQSNLAKVSNVSSAFEVVESIRDLINVICIKQNPVN